MRLTREAGEAYGNGAGLAFCSALFRVWMLATNTPLLKL